MLPTYEKIRDIFRKKLLIYMKAKQSTYMGPLSKAKHTRLYEGERCILVDDEGFISELEFKTFEAVGKIDMMDFDTTTLDDVFKHLDKLAEEMANQQSKAAFEKIFEVTDGTGNVVDLQGKPFSVDNLLEALAKIQMDFDDQGKPHLPSLVVGPELFESVSQTISETGQTPEYLKRLEGIINNKKEEWRARESNRKLVG